MNPKCDWKEEEIVDFVLGRLPVDKEAQFRRHLEDCKDCRDCFHEWEATLDMEEETMAPPARVKRQLMRDVRKTDHPQKKFPLFKKPVAVTVAMCAVLFIVLASSLFSSSPHHANQIKGNPFIPETQRGPQQVHYVPVTDHNVNGYVWVRPSTQEMMVFLQGVPRIEDRDYQVWLISDSHRSDAGTLQVNDGMAQLYFHGHELEEAHRVIVSVEPRGGSKMQTGPDKFNIEIGQ